MSLQARGRLVLVLVICGTLLGYHFVTSFVSTQHNFIPTTSAAIPPFDTLPTYILSLPQRSDRRKDMEHLRVTLGMQWKYRPATDSHAPFISKMERRVRYSRSQNATFAWPSTKHDYPPLGELEGTDVLTCALEDAKIPEFSPSLPNHLLLTRSRIACWHSHASLVSHLAQQGTGGIILEDDVDMERDIRERAGLLWSTLPENWDVVFFGHCWSDEGRNTPLPLPPDIPNSVTRIHPSNSPLCTHAYAVSAKGAEKLDLYLNYPPFAYSRAVDQAFVWLIQSGKINAFSFLPSVIVQRKADKGDIPNAGEVWLDDLIHPVFVDSRA